MKVQATIRASFSDLRNTCYECAFSKYENMILMSITALIFNLLTFNLAMSLARMILVQGQTVLHHQAKRKGEVHDN